MAPRFRPHFSKRLVVFRTAVPCSHDLTHWMPQIAHGGRVHYSIAPSLVGLISVFPFTLLVQCQKIYASLPVYFLLFACLLLL